MRRAAVLLTLSVLACLFQSPAAKAQIEPFVGQVLIVPYNFAPRGFHLCDGTILQISSNTALFSLLGTTYGGDGVHTFALPDLRGRAPVGMGQGPGLPPHNLGQTGGEETVTLDISQLPPHRHVPVATASAANTGSPSGAYWAMPRALLYSTGAPSVAMNAAAVGPVGGGLPHDNLKPYLAMNYIIALQGIFPARD